MVKKSSCVGLPIEDCMLAQTCQWTKQSKTGTKPHCRQISSWATGTKSSGLDQWREFFNEYRARNSHLSYADARTAASQEWRRTHPKKGSVKPTVTPVITEVEEDWELNPIYGQQFGGRRHRAKRYQIGGNVDREQLSEFWDYISDRLDLDGEDNEHKDEFIDDVIVAAGDHPINRTNFTIAHAMWHGDGSIRPEIFSDDKKVVLEAINEGSQGGHYKNIIDFVSDYLDQ